VEGLAFPDESRTFILPLYRGMKTVRKGVADKGGKPKVRECKEGLDCMLAFTTKLTGRSLLLGFSHMVRNSTFFMDAQLEA